MDIDALTLTTHDTTFDCFQCYAPPVICSLVHHHYQGWNYPYNTSLLSLVSSQLPLQIPMPLSIILIITFGNLLSDYNHKLPIEL